MKDLKSLEKKALSYRWIVWGIMIAAFMVVFFHRLAAGVVRDDLVQTFGLSASAFGNLASMYFYAYMVMQVPVGILADSLGARKTVTVGTFLAGLGSVTFGLAPTASVIFLGRFLVGIGVSTVFVSILKIQSQWFREREFATMSGMTALMGNLGGVFAQTPLAFMVTLFTWRMTFAGIGVFSLILACACYLLIRDRPQEMGLPAINEAQILRERVKAPLGEKTDLGQALKEVVKKWQIWPAFIFFGLVAGSYQAFAGAWGVSFLKTVYGLSKGSASAYVCFIIYGTMAGSFFSGWFSDRLGTRKLPLIGMTGMVTLLWGLLVFMNGGKPPIPLLKPLFFLIGFCSTGFILALAIVKETNSPKFTGIAISVVNTGCFLGTALVTTFIGIIIDISAVEPGIVQYHRAFMLCFISAFIGFVCTFFLPETNCRNMYFQKHNT